MSDQSPDLRDTTYVGGGGGGGVLTLNGSPVPAQVIAAGAGILVFSGGGTTTITNSGVTSYGTVGLPRTGDIVIASGTGITILEAPANTFTFSVNNAGVVTGVGLTLITMRHGDIELAAGAGISITEAPPGTFTFASTGTSGVSSFGLAGAPRTGAIAIAAGANITITEAPIGTYTIATVGGGAGITSLNGDGTAAQVIAGSGSIVVTDAGANHTVSINNFTVATAGAVPNPAGFSSVSRLTPVGWRDAEGVNIIDPFPGNGATLFQSTDTNLQTYFILFGGYALFVGSCQTSVPVAPTPTSGLSLSIKVNGAYVRTNTELVFHAVRPYMQVVHMQSVLVGSRIDLALYNGTNQNLTSAGSELDICTLLS